MKALGYSIIILIFGVVGFVITQTYTISNTLYVIESKDAKGMESFKCKRYSPEKRQGYMCSTKYGSVATKTFSPEESLSVIAVRH